MKESVHYGEASSCYGYRLDGGETIDELREGFHSLSVAQIKRLIEFAHAQRGQPNP